MSMGPKGLGPPGPSAFGSFQGPPQAAEGPEGVEKTPTGRNGDLPPSAPSAPILAPDGAFASASASASASALSRLKGAEGAPEKRRRRVSMDQPALALAKGRRSPFGAFGPSGPSALSRLLGAIAHWRKRSRRRKVRKAQINCYKGPKGRTVVPCYRTFGAPVLRTLRLRSPERGGPSGLTGSEGGRRLRQLPVPVGPRFWGGAKPKARSAEKGRRRQAAR